MRGEQVDQPSDRAGRLMLVQPQLEVHPHDGKVVARGSQLQIERAAAGGRFFKEAEDGLRIAENVGRPDEAAHRPPHRLHRDFGTHRRRSPFAIRQLLAVPDRPKRHVMGDRQPNRRFDLLRRRSQHRSIHRRGGNRAMQHVIDLVILQSKTFRQPAANFVQAQHRQHRLPAIQSRLLGCRDHDGIKIVVPKFAALVACSRVVAKVRPVGIEFPHRRTIRQHRLLRRDSNARSKNRRTPESGYVNASSRNKIGRIHAAGQCRNGTGDAIEVKLLDPREHRSSGAAIRPATKSMAYCAMPRA